MPECPFTNGTFSLDVGVTADAQEPTVQGFDKAIGDLFEARAPMISLAVYSKTCISDATHGTEHWKLLILFVLRVALTRSVLSDFGRWQGPSNGLQTNRNHEGGGKLPSE
jgi:hypothetical protein